MSFQWSAFQSDAFQQFLAASPIPAVVVTATYSGGFSTAYERQISRSRSRRDKERQAAQEALENAKDDGVQAELARLLHAQLAKQAELDDLQRLKRLVSRQALDRSLPDKVQVALSKAQQDASYSRLQALEREYKEMLEEEELALLMTLSLLD